jgi:hypothetical protein
MFILQMSNTRGFIEWYEGLSVRMQAEKRELARQFPSRDEAQRVADACLTFPSAFSDAYYDSDTGCYTMQITVEDL